MGLIQREVQKVYMWKEPYTDYSAMQGPCPSGFHVPTQKEMNDLRNRAVSSLGIAAANVNQYLLIPSGARWLPSTKSWELNANGLWTCTKGATQYRATVASTSGWTFAAISPSIAYEIRPFYDKVVVPDSSWTVLYQGTGGAGIYHNPTLGLISISNSTGTTWLTIADKNIGATSTDVTSTNSYGKHFQRGNNYGYFYGASITTTTTKVNAGSYGPGNYYSSPTFYADSSNNYWDSSENANLRGAVTGTTTGGGDIQIRPEPYIPQEYTDTLTTTYNQSTNSTTYYYGEKFTALKSGQITEVGFLHSNTLVGLMVILDVSTNTPTNFSLSTSNTTGGVYTLDTPYNIEEGKSYIIGVRRSSGNNLPYYNVNMGYPITGDVIQYTNGLSMTPSYGVSLQVAGYVFKYIKTLA